jgi:hypothetical protein
VRTLALAAAFLASAAAPARAAGTFAVPIKTVFIIVFENHNWTTITPSAAPYINNTLLPMGARATQYFNPPASHPSEPNYIWLEAGGNLGLTTDNNASAANSSATSDHLAAYLNTAGISWKSYQENVTGSTCPIASLGLYAAKHNPFVFFQDITDNIDPHSATCVAHNRPYTEFAADLQSGAVARRSA